MLLFLFSVLEETDSPKKTLLQLCQSVLPMFSSRSFTVSILTSRSFIHFYFILVYGVKECSNFLLD